jgi:sRNA-binding protein
MLTFTRQRARELELEEAEKAAQEAAEAEAKRLAEEAEKAALEQADTQPETVTETVEVVETQEASESLETVVDTITPQGPETTESEVQDESLKIPAPEGTPKRRK